MKKVISILFAVMLLTALPISGFSQEAPKDYFYGGLSHNDSWQLEGGYGGPIAGEVLAGGDLYLFFTMALGLPDSTEALERTVGSGGFKAALFWGSPKLYGGLVLSTANLDILAIQQGGVAPDDWNTYITSALGASAGGKFGKSRFGWNVELDYDFDFNESLYNDGLTIAGRLTFANATVFR